MISAKIMPPALVRLVASLLSFCRAFHRSTLRKKAWPNQGHPRLSWTEMGKLYWAMAMLS